MSKHLWSALLVGAALVVSPAVMAEDGATPHKKWEEFKKLSPEEREKFHAERKAKWEALSKEEKLTLIEEQRAKRRAAMDEKWNSLSDDDKIRYAEERMARHGKARHGTKSHGKVDAPAPAVSE